LDDSGAQKPDVPQGQPQYKRKADATDRSQDAILAALFSKTEVMILRFYQDRRLSQRQGQPGQALLNMSRHPKFRVYDLWSETVHDCALAQEA
jgi:hypothetical protein